MKIFNLFVSGSLIGVGLMFPGLLLAHAALTEALPGEGSVVNEAPDALKLSFNEEVRLLKVSMSGPENDMIDIDFTASSDAARQFSLPLPALAEGGYTVTWTILGDDSHRVEESFSFSIDPDAPESAGDTTASAGNGEDHAVHGH